VLIKFFVEGKDEIIMHKFSVARREKTAHNMFSVKYWIKNGASVRTCTFCVTAFYTMYAVFLFLDFYAIIKFSRRVLLHGVHCLIKIVTKDNDKYKTVGQNAKL
jgi:hypothetical protein